YDAPGARMGRQRYRAGARVRPVVELGLTHAMAIHQRTHQLAGKLAPRPLGVLPPPVPVHGIEHICPGRGQERRVCYEDASPWPTFATGPDRRAVCRREAGAGGEADDGLPAASEGTLGSASRPKTTRPLRRSCSAPFRETRNA